MQRFFVGVGIAGIVVGLWFATIGKPKSETSVSAPAAVVSDLAPSADPAPKTTETVYGLDATKVGFFDGTEKFSDGKYDTATRVQSLAFFFWDNKDKECRGQVLVGKFRFVLGVVDTQLCGRDEKPPVGPVRTPATK